MNSDRSPPVLVDVRSDSERAVSRIPGAITKQEYVFKESDPMIPDQESDPMIPDPFLYLVRPGNLRSLMKQCIDLPHDTPITMLISWS